MKILFSIIINALILYAITYLLWANPDKWIEAWVIVNWGYITYFVWAVLLWIINVTIRPILKILSLPLYLIFFWLVVFLINWIILKLFWYIMNDILLIPWISFEIIGFVNFIIAVAIFTVLNMVYSLLFSKK